MNRVEETIRVIDAQIGHHKKKINELTEYKKELLDKYDIPYNSSDGKMMME